MTVVPLKENKYEKGNFNRSAPGRWSGNLDIVGSDERF